MRTPPARPDRYERYALPGALVLIDRTTYARTLALYQEMVEAVRRDCPGLRLDPVDALCLVVARSGRVEGCPALRVPVHGQPVPAGRSRADALPDAVLG